MMRVHVHIRSQWNEIDGTKRRRQESERESFAPKKPLFSIIYGVRCRLGIIGSTHFVCPPPQRIPVQLKLNNIIKIAI